MSRQSNQRRVTVREVQATELSADHPRKVSVNEHFAFRESLAGPARSRKKSEVSRVLNLLDGLGEDGAE